MEKGDYTKLKLFGIGWIRDDRLHRLFQDDRVSFLTDVATTGNDESEGTKQEERYERMDRAWFNVMMVHQNRAHKGRGAKNCFEESMIPAFMDLVVFGHEHEC